MKINKKNVPFVGILILFSVLYVFFAIKPARNSLQFIPQWTIDIDVDAIAPTNSQVFPFKLGQKIGYYTPDGAIASMHILEEKGVVSNHFYAPFSTNAEEIDFFTASGDKAGVIQNAGFPYFVDDRIFLFYPSGNAFSFHSTDGTEQWSYENYVPITAFYSNINGIVAGYADGSVIVFDLKGNVLQEFSPGGSEYEIIFAASMSPSGRYVACLSGLDKQRVVVFDIEGSTGKIIFHEYVEEPVYDQRLVYFSNDEQYVFINAKDSVIIVDIETKVEKRIPVNGKVISVKEIFDGEYYFVLSKDRDTSTVSVYNKHLYTVGSFTFDGKNSFIHTDNEFIYVGSENTISKILVKKEN